ncbi:MAG: hypothetical protein ABW168_19460 [Sedimenticola sp.]
MEKNDVSPVTESSADHVESWFFSIIPIAVAFAFYIVFILYAKLENANLFIAFGAAAAMVGLESYWIIKGLRTKTSSTVVMGLTGIIITLGVLYLYLSFI